MLSSAELLRTTKVGLELRWPTFEIRELVVFLLVVQLMANAELFALALEPRGFAAVCAGFALLIYGGAVHRKRFAARQTLGWVNAPSRFWLGAMAVGCLLGTAVTMVTVVSGRATNVAEPIHNQILAVTLGPIVEEICLRGIMVPLLARVIGSRGAVVVTSVLFASLHWPSSMLELACIGATGAAYGWIRVRSGSTALATVAHATYNFTLLLFGP